MKTIFSFIAIASALTASAQTAPKQKSVLLSNGFLHIGNGNVIENSYVGFRDGVIDLVADARTGKIDISKYDTVIQLEGKHVYPAMIAPNSTLGLTEVDAVRATLDFDEVGSMNPHVRAQIAYNTDSKVVSTVKTNGVLYCQVTPRGGVISGTSAIMSLDGWNWEDAMIYGDEGVHLNFPRLPQGKGRSGADQDKDYQFQLSALKKFFGDAMAYNRSAVTEKNLRFEAMKGVLAGTKTLYIHSDFVKDLLAAISFTSEFGIKKVVFVGAKDAWKITSILKEKKIAVMLNRVHDLPTLAEDDVDLAYKTPALLQRDSVLFCLQNAGDMEAMNSRNIPFLAGTACAYGLTKEQALMSVTLSSAKIMGVDNKIGSVENGKYASLFVSTGDALDMSTNNVVLAFVQGRQVELTNPQIKLAEKYMKKYGIK